MRSRSLAAGLLAATLLTVPLATGAAAHVTVQATGEAVPGGFTKLTFRTPTERDVPTTKLEVAFPADTPIPFVSVKPRPGWTYRVTKAAPATPLEAFGEPVTEVVTRIVWTATGEGIKPGEFDEFEVSAGPLPDTDRLVFKALQTYRGGEVVRWIEEPVPGGEEPEHPAPVLRLAAPAATASPAVSPVAASDDGTDGLTVAALAGSGVALLLALAALTRSGRPRRTE